jgi:hypothetical protein
MGGENNNNNIVEDSLQLHEGLGTNVLWDLLVVYAAEGSVILPSLHKIILPVETKNNTGTIIHWGG